MAKTVIHLPTYITARSQEKKKPNRRTTVTYVEHPSNLSKDNRYISYLKLIILE